MKNMKKDFITLAKTISLFILLLIFKELFILAINHFIDLSKVSKNSISYIYLIADLMYMMILFLAYHKTLIKDFKLFIKNFGENINTSFKYWFIGLIIMMISNYLIVSCTGAIAQNEESVRSLLTSLPLYMIFSISIYAPFTEELIFRKGFKDVIENKWLYILTSGITFGAMHVVSSVTSLSDLLYLIPYCSLGIAFSSLYYKTDNIFSSMSMHFFHNTMTLLLLLIVGQ